MRVILQADRRQKQNHRNEILPAHPQEPYLSGKEFGPMFRITFNLRSCSVEEINSSSSRCKNTTRRRWNDWILENKRRSSKPFCVFSTLVWWKVEEHHGKKEEETRKDFSIVLILQDKKFFTSELFKVIQDAILLILHYKTMSWFRTMSSSTLITLDVQSICTPSSIHDWYQEANIWATDRQYSFCLIKNTKILRQSTWKHRVLHSTCIKHGRNIKTRCIGSTSNLLKRKD